MAVAGDLDLDCRLPELDRADITAGAGGTGHATLVLGGGLVAIARIDGCAGQARDVDLGDRRAFQQRRQLRVAGQHAGAVCLPGAAALHNAVAQDQARLVRVELRRKIAPDNAVDQGGAGIQAHQGRTDVGENRVAGDGDVAQQQGVIDDCTAADVEDRGALLRGLVAGEGAVFQHDTGQAAAPRIRRACGIGQRQGSGRAAGHCPEHHAAADHRRVVDEGDRFQRRLAVAAVNRQAGHAAAEETEIAADQQVAQGRTAGLARALSLAGDA